MARTVRVFDSVTRGAKSAPNSSTLSVFCFSSLKPLGIAQAQAEGVAHPYPWWTPVGKLHHTLMGIYHIMVGATDECSTAAGNGQAHAAAVSVATMSKQAQLMHTMQARVDKLAGG
jgi:hypothetical protein